MMSVKVRTPSKRISKSSESEVSTSPYHVKANNSSSKLVTPKQDVKKKKRKRSPSTCLAYLAFSSHEGFIASVVNSLLGEEDDEAIGGLKFRVVNRYKRSPVFNALMYHEYYNKTKVANNFYLTKKQATKKTVNLFKGFIEEEREKAL
ncbi:hypothetical protein QYF36_016499 [Acer negundo]|nr:hypothetical protein QYF36_016499 [Acer negundo]